MQTENNTPTVAPASEPQQPETSARVRRPRFLFRVFGRKSEDSGQAIVEFAIVSVAFFMMVFGTIDLGRAIYMYSQLHNAVREGARYGKMMPDDDPGIRAEVKDYASSFNLTDDDIEIDCNGPCYPGCASVEVTATGHFRAITQEFLGIGPLTLTAKAHVVTE
jgi:hypothetical protein